MLILILLALIASADAFLFGISFGLKKIRITFISLVMITITGIIILLLSAFAGNFISGYISCGELIGSFVLIGIGMWLCSDTENSTKNILEHPEKADINKSKIIEPKEAVVIGFVLSIDSAAIVIGSSITDKNIILLPIFILIFQIIFICIGIFIGDKGIKNIPDRLITLISGFFIVMIGLYKLSLYFY